LIVGDIENITPARTILYASWYNWDTGAYDIPAWTWEPLSGSGLDPNLKPEYSDQFSAALEREIFSDFSLSATFVYKQTKNIIGLHNTTAQYTEFPVLDEYSGNVITLFNTTDGKDQYLTNPGDEASYKAFMLVANKRISNNFQFYSSFTWSESYYKAKGYIDKNELINAEDAPRWRDRRWMAKFGGVYFAPLGIVIGTNITWQQGLPWARELRVAGLLDQGWGAKTVYAEPFGSRRYPNNFFCDLKIEKTFQISSRVRISANFDILNLFNMDTNLEWVSNEAENPYWMVPTGIILPRRAIVGVRLEF
jgi:outer membrane receptor protein involved in Fe transport